MVRRVPDQAPAQVAAAQILLHMQRAQPRIQLAAADEVVCDEAGAADEARAVAQHIPLRQFSAPMQRVMASSYIIMVSALAHCCWK